MEKSAIVQFPLNRDKASKEGTVEYVLLTDKSYEDSGTAKVIWEILIKSKVTRQNLTVLLEKLYAQAVNTEFKHHDKARVIDIKAFMSKEHAESGMAQWVAWMSMTPSRPMPSILFDERQIGVPANADSSIQDIPEANRREIWNALIRAEDRASQEAERLHPDPLPNGSDTYLEVLKIRRERDKSLQVKYHQEIETKYGIGAEQLKLIGDEGLRKSWPFPR